MDSSRDPPLEFEQPCKDLPEWFGLACAEHRERSLQRREELGELMRRVQLGERLRFKLSDLELLRRKPSLPVPWRLEQLLLKYDEPFTKQMLLNFRDRSLFDLEQAWRSLSEDVIPQIKSYIIWMKKMKINLEHVDTRVIKDLIAQVLLAKLMGQKQVVVGQFGNGDANYVIAVAALCEKIGLPCTVYMDAQAKEKQTSVALQLQFWSAKVNVINLGTPKLEDAKSAARLDWLNNFQTTHFIEKLGFLEYEDPELQPVKCPLDYDGQQNFKLNHPPICPHLSFTVYPIGNSVRKSVMETILDDVSEQKSAFDSLSNHENFQKQVAEVLKSCCGGEIPRKSPIGNWPCRGLRKEFPILTGSHNIVNAVVQILLAKGLGKKRIIVATRDGQHGLAVADICASVGLQCIIYMDAQDVEEQRSKMQLLHAEVRAVDPGMDSKSAAIWDWVTNIEITHYISHYIMGSNAMATGAMSYSVPDDDDDEPEPSWMDYIRCRYCDENISRQNQEYHNQLYHQSVGAKLVPGVAALASEIATLTQNVEGYTDHFWKLCTWLSSNFEELDNLLAILGSLSEWVHTTGLQQICEKWKNDTVNLASVSKVVSKLVHVLGGVTDKAARIANKAEMAIIPARVAAVRAAAARLGSAGTAAAPTAIAEDSGAHESDVVLDLRI